MTAKRLKVFAHFKITEADGTELLFAAAYDNSMLATLASEMIESGVTTLEVLDGLLALVVKRVESAVRTVEGATSPSPADL